MFKRLKRNGKKQKTFFYFYLAIGHLRREFRQSRLVRQ
jgi:hypothetical protein